MNNIQAQNQAWKYAPKAFREAVKKLFAERFGAISTYGNIMSEIFGKHNLTSDAEGEEMLTVSAITIREMYAANERIKTDTPDKELGRTSDHINHVLRCLFGSKCLPDDIESLSQNPSENCDNGNHISTDDNKPAEPKFTKGGMVHCKSFGYEGDYKVLEYTGGPRNCYDCIDKYGAYYRFYESDLEPYIEPKKRKIERKTGGKLENPQSDQIANCDNQFDDILKDSFRNERRLNIAAMMAQALLTRIDDTPQVIADTAFRHADALITESEKGGSHEKA